MKIEIKENSITLDGVEYIKEQPTPKDGEIWYVESHYRWLVVMKSEKEAYFAFCLDDGQIITTSISSLFSAIEKAPKKPASVKHIALLHTKLKENGKKWNAEKKCLEDLPKPLKEGDLAIFWDNDKRCAVIGVYKKSITVSYNSLFTHLRIGGVQYINAIPFENIEQYKEFVK